MGSTPVCQITAAGCVRPTFADCLAYVQGSYRAIYGQDLVLEASTQDGQFMALLANAIHDANGETLAAYNAYSPSTAQGGGLSSVVKINGIRRKSPTYSTCDFLNVGQAFTQITGGVITDAAGYRWTLPDFVIPATGQILVTGTCQTIGAIALSAGAVDTANGKGSIATIQRGWQSVVNLSAATLGNPVETDSQLRQRQALSTALPAQTLIEALAGTLWALSGMSRLRVYENDTGVTDANGVPGHCISVIADGGDAEAIAKVIAAKKSPGVGTYGDVLFTLTDAYGIPKPVRFSRPTLTPIAWYVTLRPRAGYTMDVAAQIQASLAAYTNALGIGASQALSGGYPAANLTGQASAPAFEIVGLRAARTDTSNDAYGDVVCAYDEALTCDPSDVVITTVTN